MPSLVLKLWKFEDNNTEGTQEVGWEGGGVELTTNLD